MNNFLKDFQMDELLDEIAIKKNFDIKKCFGNYFNNNNISHYTFCFFLGWSAGLVNRLTLNTPQESFMLTIITVYYPTQLTGYCYLSIFPSKLLALVHGDLMSLLYNLDENPRHL